MASSRALLRTWSGPVDCSSSAVFALLSSGPVHVGGRQHLERLERVHGRLLLRVSSSSTPERVVLSRQLSNRKVRSYALFDDRFGLQMGGVLRSLRSLGARESLLMHLGGSAASCGRMGEALQALQAVRPLVGGGVNFWVEDLTRLIRRRPHLLPLLPLLQDADAAGLRPYSLESALELAQVLERCRQVCATPALSRATVPTPASDASPRFSGFELVAHPSSARVMPSLLRALAPLGEVRLEVSGSDERVVLAVPDLAALPDLVAAMSSQLRWLLSPESFPSLLEVGLPGVGLRFVWPLEFGRLPAVALQRLRRPVEGPAADAAEDLRRQAEDRRADPHLLASHLLASGMTLDSMPANLQLRLLRLSEEGFMPGSAEWEALLDQVASR